MKLSALLSNPYRELEKKLGYRFKNRRHLEAALTHRSYRFEKLDTDTDNQRLEFLGDAVLGLLAAEYVYEKYPQHREGPLTQLRSRLTNTRALSIIGQQWGLAHYLKLGKGEATQLARRTTTIPDAVEAVLGAVYLDGGLKPARKLFLRWVVPNLDQQPENALADNPKGALQEMAQKKWRANPVYHVVKVEGPPHERVFTCQVEIGGKIQGIGRAPSKRQAESQAALEALRKLTGHLPVAEEKTSDKSY